MLCMKALREQSEAQTSRSSEHQTSSKMAPKASSLMCLGLERVYSRHPGTEFVCTCFGTLASFCEILPPLQAGRGDREVSVEFHDCSLVVEDVSEGDHGHACRMCALPSAKTASVRLRKPVFAHGSFHVNAKIHRSHGSQPPVEKLACQQ